MATPVSTVLNQLLASNFSDVTKLRKPDYKDPLQLAASFDAAQAQGQQQLPALTEQDTDNHQRSAGYQQQQARQQSLKDLNRPQIALSPSDELQLFANPEAPVAANVTQSNFLSDQANTARRQVLTLNNRDNLNEVLQQRAQQAVSSLYARNNDIVYNAEPVISQAA